MSAQFSVLISLLLLATAVEADHQPAPNNSPFQVSVSPWSGCNRLNATLDCYRTRETVCVRASDNATAPWYYCNTSRDSFPTVEACLEGSCVQNCAVSQWGSWSSCNCSVDLFRSRSRSVVSPPRNGGFSCPGLVERSLCGCALHFPFDSQPRRYTWKTGEWQDCRALDASSQCGNGLRSRTVLCVDLNGHAVPPANCLREPAYSRLHPPSPEMLCEIPCPCELGDWGLYSPCTPLCNTVPLQGVQIRTRPIVRSPTLGLLCAAVEEARACSISADACPTYIWEVSGWSSCIFQTGATCGDGHMTRYAHCTKVQNGEIRSIMDDSKCRHLDKPLLLQACQASCPQPCLVGAWSEWTDCPRSYQQTYSNRTRSVIVPPLEEACPHTVEFHPCPLLPRARYLLNEAGGVCTLSDPQCGSGIESRGFKCVDPNDQEINLRDCYDLPNPVHTVPCYIPCPNDCVVSDWSEWSPCSEACGGLIGNQTRQRHYVARGLYCPYTDSDLTETRACSEPRECGLTRYHVREEPWGVCMAGEDTMQSSASPPDGGMLRSDESGFTSCTGSGVHNRTRFCVENDQVIPSSDCPLVFEPIQFESCELPCTSQCVLSEWSPYSSCSASCGTGSMYRTRHLLQFPSSDLSACGVDQDELAEDGLVVEFVACEVEACVEVVNVTWYETDWSSCNLYHTVDGNLEPGSCGLGYQTRNATCMVSGTGVIVSDSSCYDTVGPRPSMIRSCHQQCADRCLVTEWSEFTTCEFGGSITSHREVVPLRGCNSVDECCPQLSSIKVSQSLSCPAFVTNSYNYVESSPFGKCILDSPTDTCGNGYQYRSVVCQDRSASSVREEQVVVDSSFCRMAGRSIAGQLTTQCNIRCNRNCIQSEWGEWGPCSATCGSGVRSRSRNTYSRGEVGGRPCGPVSETDVCSAEPCPYAEVIRGPFGECVLDNSTALCGTGQRTRDALCFINGEPRDFSTCAGLGATVSFALSEPCISDCPGECVTGEWGAWSPCNPRQRYRSRAVLRAEPDGMCMKMLQDIQTCPPSENPYHWAVLPWEDCVISSLNAGVVDAPSREQYCGVGVRSRIVRCQVNATGSTVPDKLCTEAGLTKPAAIESCVDIPCPIDCVVGAFSDWTECEPCVFNSVQNRTRKVIIANTSGGEECPDLEQTKPCVPTNCTATVRISHTPFIATDYTMDSQCGSALVWQPVSCRSNTVFMSPAECRAGADRPVDSHERLPCPVEPNCTFGEWSDWSDCLSLCHTPGVRFTFRTRGLVSSLPGLTAACEAQQHQQRECPLELTTQSTSSENGTDLVQPTLDCVDFAWQVSEWDQNGRDVYCLSNIGTRVEDSGCPHSRMPRSQNETCVGPCPSRATCNDEEGICVITCDVNSEKVQGACLPLVGCFADAHCLRENTFCNSRGGCECVKGFEMVRGRNGEGPN